MSKLFDGWRSFNQPLEWDTSAVTNLESTFDGCSSFNQPLEWDTSAVTNLESTFDGCSSFNQPLEWDTSSAKRMCWMFRGCSSFDQPLSHFDTSKVTDMDWMFDRCVRFNRPLEWNTTSVKMMGHMFEGAMAFNHSLVWDTRNVDDMTGMFYRCGALMSTILFDMKSVRSSYEMLEGCGEGARVKDANIGGLMDLRLSDGDIKIPDTDETILDPFACTCCNERIARVRFHMPYSAESGESESRPHMYCGACVQNTIIAQWRERDANVQLCPLCRAPFELIDLLTFPFSDPRETSFGYYARKAAAHKRRAGVYMDLQRAGIAAAHDARARWYAIAAARAASRPKIPIFPHLQDKHFSIFRNN
jgi:surface protein